MKQDGKQTGSKSCLSHSVILVRKKKKSVNSNILCICFLNTEKNGYKSPSVMQQRSFKINFVSLTMIKKL